MSFEPGVEGVHQDRPLGRRAKNRLTGLTVDFVSMVKAGDNPSARMVLLKRRPDGDPNDADGVDKQDNGDDMDRDEALQGAPDAVVAYVESLEDGLLKAEAERDEALDKAKKAPPADADDEGKDGEEDMEKILKGVADPALRSLLLKQQADVAKANADAAEAKALAQAEKDARSRMILKTRVEQSMGHLGDVDETVDLLQKVAKAVDSDAYGSLEALLTKASNQVTLGEIFKEYGTPGYGSTAADPLEAEAARIQKADPSLSYAQAYDRAMETNPAMYHEAIQVGGGN